MYAFICVLIYADDISVIKDCHTVFSTFSCSYELCKLIQLALTESNLVSSRFPSPDAAVSVRVKNKKEGLALFQKRASSNQRARILHSLAQSSFLYFFFPKLLYLRF